MMPLFPFLLGAAATALLTTDSGRKLADRIGAAVTSTARARYDEVMDALGQQDGQAAHVDAEQDKEKERDNERDA